ncbi:MAG: NUMOD4 motif-containing HNH endonuclease [Bacteroidales bacterium]|nr:NUMOD4 motif-containing HNH endonuclease [Bacteroidales bacterium]
MTRNYPGEIWKKLVVEDLHPSELYEISNYGRLKSFKTHPRGRIIRIPLIKGYRAIVLKLNNNKTVTKYIHKLVAEHFLPKDSELQQYVIHIDFNKENNRASNLRWVTRSTMFAHQKINPNYKRGKIRNAKLTVEQVIRIKQKLQEKDIKFSVIAKEFGITHTQLNRIRQGINWAHVKVS